MNNNQDHGRGYYGGGCFTGESMVLMADGSSRQVRCLAKGDKIATPHGSAEVRCVVKRRTLEGKVDLCQLQGGLQITPGHPVKVNGAWSYPRDLAERKTAACDAIFNLVVDTEHIAIINGVETILLGHSYSQGILHHEYYGSQKVIDDLRRLPGFDAGFVEILPRKEAKEFTK